MSIQERLESFRQNHSGIDHLVYADLSAGMVLVTASATPRRQEDHDALVVRGSAAMSESVRALANGLGSDVGCQVLVKDGRGNALIIAASSSPDEAFVLSVADDTNTRAISLEAVEILTELGAEA